MDNKVNETMETVKRGINKELVAQRFGRLCTAAAILFTATVVVKYAKQKYNDIKNK